MKTIYKGSVTRVFGELTFAFLAAGSISFLVYGFLTGGSQPYPPIYNYLNLTVFFGFMAIRAIRLIKQLRIQVEISGDSMIIRESSKKQYSYSLADVQAFCSSDVFAVSGLPVSRKVILRLADMQGTPVAEHNISGIAAKKLNELIESLQSRHTAEHLPESKEASVVSAAGGQGNLSVDRSQSHTFPLGIKSKDVNRGIKRLCTVMAVIFGIFGIFDFINPDNESMYLLIFMLAGVFAFFRLLLGLRKNPLQYPAEIIVTADKLVLDKEVIAWEDLEQICYTPVNSERVYRTLYLAYKNGRKRTVLLGRQDDASNPQEREKFIRYPEFVAVLTGMLAGSEMKVVEDVTLSWTRMIYQ